MGPLRKGRWSVLEDNALYAAVQSVPLKAVNWNDAVWQQVRDRAKVDRTPKACKARWPTVREEMEVRANCEKAGKGGPKRPWTAYEDELILDVPLREFSATEVRRDWVAVFDNLEETRFKRDIKKRWQQLLNQEEKEEAARIKLCPEEETPGNPVKRERERSAAPDPASLRPSKKRKNANGAKTLTGIETPVQRAGSTRLRRAAYEPSEPTPPNASLDLDPFYPSSFLAQLASPFTAATSTIPTTLGTSYRPPADHHVPLASTSGLTAKEKGKLKEKAGFPTPLPPPPPPPTPATVLSDSAGLVETPEQKPGLRRIVKVEEAEESVAQYEGLTEEERQMFKLFKLFKAALVKNRPTLEAIVAAEAGSQPQGVVATA